ncbi:GTP 3',8-cyclase MoaA [Membranihabitans maritimus]|uniref:GTP 3',8-cyclase MoaA n=1 Tax=Membranihabitans maritimus TaxID=2904244 RepID=UPI001F005C39|nr:GTP 3',8-cyclase MoaA [Membranihabitans maritimus]
MLVDNHNRAINYLRLAVTDRCNLRCNYCMPEEGIEFAKRDDLLTMEELCKISSILVEQGIDKIRLTGGEPFVRKDLMVLIRYLAGLEGLKTISVTTNNTVIGPYLDELKELGVTDVNVSLDAINESAFQRITRRDQHQLVMDNLMAMIAKGFNIRVNCIALEGQNIEEIIPMLDLTREHNVSVRFLEEMPFNGGSKSFNTIKWNYKKIFDHIQSFYPDIEEIPSEKTSTSINYRIKGFRGTFGLIPSFTRTFCGSCNRLRISATGDVITCLYGKPRLNIREFIRLDSSGEAFRESIVDALQTRSATGFEEQEMYDGVFENSMTSIGG